MGHICIPFIKDFPYNDDIEEFTIKYNPQEDEYVDLFTFIEIYRDKRINIELTETGFDTVLLKALLQINPEIYLKLDEGYVSRLEEFQEHNVKYFFSFLITNWDTLNSVIKAGVSDVYISGELGFCWEDINKVLHTKDRNINSRVIVNLAQADDPFGTSEPIKVFFIRPEDMQSFDSVIDTFEFYYDDKSKITTLYEIYMLDKQWFGDLSPLITGLNMYLDSRTLLPQFASYRYNCGKRCYKGSNCNICGHTVLLSEVLAEKEMFFSQGEQKEEGINGS